MEVKMETPSSAGSFTMRVSKITSLCSRTASIFLPKTPPMTPIMGQQQDTNYISSWMRSFPMYRDHETKSLIDKDEKAHISIEDEKTDELMERSNLLSTVDHDDKWITNVDIAKMGNLPYLSGMRAVASIAIQVYHLVKPGTRSASYFGCCALSIHFVQGAFLITGALLQLQEANQGKSILQQHTHLPRFFFSRWVRLYPALLVMIIVTSFWWQKRYDKGVHLAKAVFRAVFKIQHTKIFTIPDTPPNPFAHTWFLDVQEAFYLTWALGLPVLVLLDTKFRAVVLTALFVFSFRRRLKENLFNAALSINMWKMVAGAALQLIPIPRSFVQQYSKMVATALLACGILWGSSAYLNDNFKDKMHRVHGDVAGVIATFAVTMAALHKKPQPPSLDAAPKPKPQEQTFVSLMLSHIFSPLNILNAKWLDFIGRISYSWYLWQIPVMHYETQFMNGYDALGSTCEAFILAMISTVFLEEPIRDWYRARLKRAKMAAIISKQETK